MPKYINWGLIRKQYISGILEGDQLKFLSLKELAKFHHVSYKRISQKAKEDNWEEAKQNTLRLKKAFGELVLKKSAEKLSGAQEPKAKEEVSQSEKILEKFEDDLSVAIDNMVRINSLYFSSFEKIRNEVERRLERIGDYAERSSGELEVLSRILERCLKCTRMIFNQQIEGKFEKAEVANLTDEELDQLIEKLEKNLKKQ